MKKLMFAGIIGLCFVLSGCGATKNSNEVSTSSVETSVVSAPTEAIVEISSNLVHEHEYKYASAAHLYRCSCGFASGESDQLAHQEQTGHDTYTEAGSLYESVCAICGEVEN